MTTVFLDADDFHERFEDAPIIWTGTLLDSVAFFANWCAGAHGELMGQPTPLVHYLCLGGDGDPYAELKSAAASIAIIHAKLREAGFESPPVDYRQDPIGFLEANAQFLNGVAPFLGHYTDTVH